MKEHDPDSRGARDASAILPFLGVVLLSPPLVYIFAAPVTVGGIPLIVAYVFGVWAAIILVAFLVSRRLEPDASEAARLPGPPETR